MIAKSFNQEDSDVIARYADINVVVTVTANAVWCYSEYSLGRTIAQIRPAFLALSGAEGAVSVTSLGPGKPILLPCLCEYADGPRSYGEHDGDPSLL